MSLILDYKELLAGGKMYECVLVVCKRMAQANDPKVEGNILHCCKWGFSESNTGSRANGRKKTDGCSDKVRY